LDLRDWTGRRVVLGWAVWLALMSAVLILMPDRTTTREWTSSPPSRPSQLEHLPRRQTEVTYDPGRLLVAGALLVPPVVLTALWLRARRRVAPS
jgi:hypothetical protein